MNERELKTWMTPEQKREWNRARKYRLDTHLHIGAPDCGCDGLFSPQCNDDGEWYEAWRGTCFDVSDGEACVFDWDCDCDGNWDYSYRCKLREYTDAKAQQDYEDAGCVAHEYHEATKGKFAGERASSALRKQIAKHVEEHVEVELAGLPVLGRERLSDAMEAAGLSDVYCDMPPDSLGKVIEFIVNWRKENKS